MSSPSVVLIAGSWHQGRCFERIMKPLEEKHHLNCISITLPSTLGDPNSTFKDDIDAARKAITAQTSQGRDVVVVAHSFGGMVGNSAIKGLTSSKTAKENATPSGGAGGVIGLILIASGFTLTGMAFMDATFGVPPPSWRINKETGFADLARSPQKLFYHDLSPEDADYWVSQLGKQNLKAMFEGGKHAYAGWKDVPVYYIGTAQDHGLPVAVQRMQVGMARAMGANVEHRELESSHSPFLSMPEECVEIILEAISVFSGGSTSGASLTQPAMSAGQTKVIVPAARLLSPVSWIRYGLPLLLGRAVGSCISAFAWLRDFWKPTRQ